MRSAHVLTCGRYKLTADVIESIFRTYPAVRKQYLLSVPDEVRAAMRESALPMLNAL